MSGKRFIDPLTDFGFKKIFGSEPNKDLLIDFLNLLLPEKHQILELNYTKNDEKGYTAFDRSASFDIQCKGKNGEFFIVEMQKAKQQFFKDRSVYYSTFPIQEQAPQGDWNFKLAPVYTVGVLDFTFDDGLNDEVVQQVQLKNQDCDVFYEKLSYIFIELPKFTKSVDELETHFDKWLYLLRHLSELDEVPPALQEFVFKKVFKIAEVANYTREEKEAYERSLKKFRDLNNVIDTAKIDARKEEQLATLKRLSALGRSIEIMMDATGLSEEEIKKLSGS